MRVPRAPRRWRGLALAAALAAMTSSCSLVGPGSTYTVRARFANGIGLYAGDLVTVLGIRIGTLTSVVNDGRDVVATMAIDDSQPLPAAAHAVVVGQSVLGQRYVQFVPAYTGGARLPAGAVVPLDRTSVPVSTDQLLSSLQGFLGQIKPSSAADLVTNLAGILDGQGAHLNSLIHNAAGTLNLLAAKGNDLGRLDDSLAQLTGTLRTRDAGITLLIHNYDTVSGVLGGAGSQLGPAIDQLNRASSVLADFLAPNLAPLQDDIAVITTAGRTLERNLPSLDTGLESADALFAGTQRAYDPTHQWLRLNLALTPTTTAAVVVARVRDLLAGVCRRLLAHHAAGLPAAALSQLARCGDPSSGYFDPLLNLVPNLLGKLTKGTGNLPSLSSPQALLQQGLAEVPSLSGTSRTQLAQQLSALPASLPTTSPVAGSSSPFSTPAPAPEAASKASSPGRGGLGGLAGKLAHLLSSIGGRW